MDELRERASGALARLADVADIFAFNPNQKRDARGRWTKGGGAPSIPSVSEGGGAGAGGGAPVRKRAPRRGASRKPLTDKQFQERADYVDRTMSANLKEHATDRRYAPGGVWTPERDAMHREIADELYARAANVPNDGRAVMAGGLGGAGKSTVLRDYAGIDQSQYLTVNPDDVKEEMAKRGLVPEVPGAEDLSPMERSALVHEESSRIAQMVAQKAYADKKNIIWDITMSSQPSIDSRIDAMRNAGYGDVQGVFVDIPTETSVERALSRYRRGIDDWLQGKGPGGRYVPPRIIRAQQTSSGQTVNRESFDATRGRFDGWSVYDNSVTGRAPKLVSKSNGNDSEGASRSPGAIDESEKSPTPAPGAYIPPHIRETQRYLDGEGRAMLPLSYLYGQIGKQSWRDHFAPGQRARVLRESREILKGMSETARDRPMVERTIKWLEEILEEEKGR
jgi:predicted ABC-type ATPase